jgi:hypothetical protein
VKIRILNGPYEGELVAIEDLTTFSMVRQFGERFFFVLPPYVLWEDVRSGRLLKDGPFPDKSLVYELHLGPFENELRLDPSGRAMAECEAGNSLKQSSLEIPSGPHYYECVKADLLSDKAGWVQIKDEQDRCWSFRVIRGGRDLAALPDGILSVTVFAESLQELVESLSAKDD